MRILIIGAVAAGTSAAAKARRNSEENEIVIYEKTEYISYAACGMPYYIGGEVDGVDELAPRDPEFFKSKYNVDIKIGHEVEKINPMEKTLEIRDLESGSVFIDRYDKLIIASGARAFIPPIKGRDLPHVFKLRNINDMNRIKAFIDEGDVKSSLIVGTGFIGLEMAENLKALGIEITMVEMLNQVSPGLDGDMAIHLEDHLIDKGNDVFTGTWVDEINSDNVLLSNGQVVDADLVLLATGVRPNVELAKDAGLELGISGAIKVDEKMRTNIEDIYACGDCIETFNLITGKSSYSPLGSTANKTGRIAGDNVSGGDLSFRGILGTGIFKVFDLTVGQTGLSEKTALEEGYDVVVSHNIKVNKPEYMEGQEMIIKSLADRKSGRLLGAQIIGREGVDKRIDVFVTAITFKAKVDDLFHLDLAYAPPYSTSKDPVMYSGMILDNIINRKKPLITGEELINSDEKYQVIDTRLVDQYEKAHIESALNIPLAELREKAKKLDKDIPTIVYCNGGVTGNAAQNILLNMGFKEVYNLSGGYKQYSKVNL